MRSRIALLFSAAFLIYASTMVIWTYPLIARATTDAILQVDVHLESFKRNDLRLCIGGGARNANALLSLDFKRLIDNQVCYPMPMAATLGEHLIETGLLSLPVYALTRNPILAYNSAVFISFLIAGMGMFSLVWYWTRCFPAALVAGLLFAFHPMRASEIAHLHVIGIHWLPLILLFFDRLLRFGKASDSVLLALCAALQCLVGSYPLVIMVSIALPFGMVRLIQYRNVLDIRRVGLTSAAIVMMSGVALAVLLPYFFEGTEWQAIKTRTTSLIPFWSLLPGEYSSVGVLGPGLALILPGLWVVARLMRWASKRNGGGQKADYSPVTTTTDSVSPMQPAVQLLPKSPGIAVLSGTVLCTLLAGRGILWPGGPAFSGLYSWLASHFWVLGIVRVPATVRLGLYLGLACLAGLGLAALHRYLSMEPARSDGRTALLFRQRLAHGVAASLVLLVSLELFHPSLHPLAYGGHKVKFGVESHAPKQNVLHAYSIFDELGLPGPILEIPFPPAERILYFMPHYILLGGYHLRATAACFNSHIPPTYHNIARTVAKLPSPAAIQELAAIGLRNLVIQNGLQSSGPKRIIAGLDASNDTEVVYQGATMTSIRIVTPVTIHADPVLLEPLAVSRRSNNLQNLPRTILDITIENTSDETWALPQPIQAELGIVRWWHRNDLVDETEVRVLLPLALAGHAQDKIEIDIGPPPDRCGNCVPEIELPRLGWKLRPIHTNAAQ